MKSVSQILQACSRRNNGPKYFSGPKTILRDSLLFMFFLAIAIMVSNLLSNVHQDNNQFASSVFMLAVALIARFTSGYIYGILASLLSVFFVNYIFTYPYWEFNMTITGYPLTFITMLFVSICISTLTTRIKKAEQLRLEMEMEKMRGNLLRSISHDIRTPLTSIVGSSSVLLESSDLDAQQKNELLFEINKDARWLARITENILSVTKLSNGRVTLKKEYEVLEEIVSSAIVKFRKTHGAMPISVSKPEDILLTPMDATLIEQVILNLLDNAVTHGKRTTKIEISITKQADCIALRVSDDGNGIPPHIFPHLFDGRASACKPQADEGRNMGIGLSVCQSIINAHGGMIRAFNNEHGGASFEFSLPDNEDNKHEHS